MPEKIRSVWQQYDNVLGGDDSMEGLSDIQKQLLGIRSADKKSYSEQVVETLDKIFFHEDKLITSATSALKPDSKPMYRVPPQVTDNELLYLKTQGLVSGQGRVVAMTDKGKGILQSSWLSEISEFHKNRKKPKFDFYKAAQKKGLIKTAQVMDLTPGPDIYALVHDEIDRAFPVRGEDEVADIEASIKSLRANQVAHYLAQCLLLDQVLEISEDIDLDIKAIGDIVEHVVAQAKHEQQFSHAFDALKSSHAPYYSQACQMISPSKLRLATTEALRGKVMESKKLRPMIQAMIKKIIPPSRQADALQDAELLLQRKGSADTGSTISKIVVSAISYILMN